MLDERELGEYIDRHFTATLFRLETLDHYDVGAEETDFDRYLAGEPGPTNTWPDVIRDEVSRGLHTYRVHVVRSPLSAYLRYEIEWCYLANSAAGEHIRIIDTAECEVPDAIPDHDFWLIDDDHVILMHYRQDGVFERAELGPPEIVPEYIAARNAAWSAGEDLAAYWSRNPQYHRNHRSI